MPLLPPAVSVCSLLQGTEGKRAHMEKKYNIFLLFWALGHENQGSHYCCSLTVSGFSPFHFMLGLYFPVPLWLGISKATPMWQVLVNELGKEAYFTSLLAHIIINMVLSKDFYPSDKVQDGGSSITLDPWGIWWVQSLCWLEWEYNFVMFATDISW